MTAPYISVLLPVYNAGAFLDQAVQSILSQTEHDLELIAIDDGSTDGSGKILDEFARRDRRVRVIHRENRGLIKTLNEGLDIARGEFIARMDADDISLPRRLELQAAFMRSNPDVGISGCWSETIGLKKSWYTRFPTSHAGICAHMLFNTAISHPTAMFRTALFRAENLKYDDKYRHGEDYALWVHAAVKTKLANLPAVLFRYRQHEHQVSHIHAQDQAQAADKARYQMFQYFGLTPSDDEWSIHQSLCHGQLTNLAGVTSAREWLSEIIRRMRTQNHPMANAVVAECKDQIRRLNYRQYPIRSLPHRLFHKLTSS